MIGDGSTEALRETDRLHGQRVSISDSGHAQHGYRSASWTYDLRGWVYRAAEGRMGFAARKHAPMMRRGN